MASPACFWTQKGSRFHGLNERIRVRVRCEARDYHYDLVRIYAK